MKEKRRKMGEKREEKCECVGERRFECTFITALKMSKEPKSFQFTEKAFLQNITVLKFKYFRQPVEQSFDSRGMQIFERIK